MRDVVLRAVMMCLAVLFVLLIVLEMNGLLGGEWTTVAQYVAPVGVALMIFGLAAAYLGELI